VKLKPVRTYLAAMLRGRRLPGEIYTALAVYTA